MRAHLCALTWLLAFLTSCIADPGFRCFVGADCPGGVCETSGYCSFLDETCPAKRRYGEHAAEHSGQCVEENAPPPGEPDAAAGDEGVRDAAGTPSDADLPPSPPDAAAPSSDAAPCSSTYTIVGDPLSWPAAEAACEALGAHLMVVDEASELSLLASVSVGDDMWIGLNDRLIEGAYLWVTGMPPTITDWAPGEPASNADCVSVIPFGTWRTTVCSSTLAYICECDGSPPVPGSF